MATTPQPRENGLAASRPLEVEKSSGASLSTSLTEENNIELEKLGTKSGTTIESPTSPEPPSSESVPTKVADSDGADDVEAHHYGWRFYAVYSGLIATTLLSALDGAIVATALPTIAATLETGPNYVWVANVYFLTG